MATDAIVEGFGEAPLPIATTPQEEQITEVKDNALAALDQHAGWVALRERMQARIDEHRGLRSTDTSGMSLAEIGQRFVIGDAVAAELESFINLVDQTITEVEKNERAKSKRGK